MIPGLSAIGLTQPLGFLFFAPIAAALYYAYLRKRKLKQVVIPSFFLLKDLAREVSNRQRFIPPPRFWFELLLLALLVLCVAGIFRRSESARYAVLIDNSQSTAFSEGNRRMLDVIKADAISTVTALPGDNVYDVFQISPDLKRLGESNMNVQKVSGVLSAIEAVASEDRIGEHVSSLMQRAEYSGLIVFTDRDVRLPEQALEANKIISLHVSGAESRPQRENLALTSFHFDPDPGDAARGSIKIGVHAFTVQPIKGEIAIEQLSESGALWEPLTTVALDLAADEAKTFSVRVDTEGVRALRVQLSASSSARQRDQLSDDNFAYLAFHRENRTIYVVSLRSLDELGITKIRGITFKAVSPQNYAESLSEPDAQTYLFADFIPDGLPAKNLIIVSPPNGTGGFQVGGLIAAAEVSEWMTGHPLLTYIDIASLRFSRFVPILPAVWSDTVISTSRGAALIAGMRGAFRTIVTGFDLFPYRGRASPTVSVLFLNMLRWASSQSLGDESTKPFEPIALPSETSVISRFGSAPAEMPIAWQRGGLKLAPEVPGIYIARTPNKPPLITSVNFLSAHESDPRVPLEQITAEMTKVVVEKHKHHVAFADWIVPLLLAIFVLDALYLLLVSAGLMRRRSLGALLRGRAAA